AAVCLEVELKAVAQVGADALVWTGEGDQHPDAQRLPVRVVPAAAGGNRDHHGAGQRRGDQSAIHGWGWPRRAAVPRAYADIAAAIAAGSRRLGSGISWVAAAPGTRCFCGVRSGRPTDVRSVTSGLAALAAAIQPSSAAVSQLTGPSGDGGWIVRNQPLVSWKIGSTIVSLIGATSPTGAAGSATGGHDGRLGAVTGLCQYTSEKRLDGR